MILNTGIFLFSYKEENLDKDLVLRCWFFSGFCLSRRVRETCGRPGFWSCQKIWAIDRPQQSSPKGD
ncbi:hypothetical protein D0A37_12350 [Microcoleus vaginatus HSN003]|nr:hypothetical protein D0A37_12350 [Microcoleus vaginatus HSN003]